MGVPEKSDASKALKQIYDTVKQLYTLLKVFQIDLKENTDLLKQLVHRGTGSSSGETVTYEGMLNYIAQHPVPNITTNQISIMYNRGYNKAYISALTGKDIVELDKIALGIKHK